MSSNVKKQFERARMLGWLPKCERAALRHNLNPALILALASRETDLNPRYLSEPGDHGNGFGLTQVDRRSYPEFVASGKWRDAEACFEFAARKLSQERQTLLQLAGKPLQTRFRSGMRRSFVGVALTEADALRVTIAGYNCGVMTAYYHFSKRRQPDQGTTGGNYSADVFHRAAQFQAMWEPSRTIKSVQHQPSAPPIISEPAPLIPAIEVLPPARTDSKKSVWAVIAGVVGQIGATVAGWAQGIDSRLLYLALMASATALVVIYLCRQIYLGALRERREQ